MSIPGTDRHQGILDKPPAATTGSPGTTIFSPPPIQPPRLKAATPSPEQHNSESQTLPTRKPSHDHVPTQWSFESTYGMFGGVSGAGYPPQSSRIGHKDPRDGGGGVLGGSWFGRRKDKDELRFKHTSEPDQGRNTNNSSVQLSYPDLLLPTSEIPNAISSRGGHELDGLPRTLGHSTMHMSSMSSLQQAPLRPTRSLMRQSPPANSNGNADWSSNSAFSLTDSTTLDENKSRSSTPLLLSTLTASNLPTTHGGNIARSFTDGMPAGLSQKLHNNTLRRLHTASSTPSHSPSDPSSATMTRSRRPATSSGVSSHRGQERTAFPGDASAKHDPSTSIPPRFFATPRNAATPASAPTVSVTRNQRTLEEETPMDNLRNGMKDAREISFRMKGGKRHHPQKKEDAPYPRAYERKVIDHDRWEHGFTVRLAKRCTFYSFQTPPRKVLDLGCGSGEWILDCAREWKDTSFVGLDLVPIQPDLMRLGKADLGRRIEWVIGNFLQRLPFEDEEFDFVHVRRIARGVPEDRWDPLFEEITRVLKKGGAFEMLEEDLFFPGSITTADDEGADEEEAGIEIVGKLDDATPPRRASSSVGTHGSTTSEGSPRGTKSRTPVQQGFDQINNEIKRVMADRRNPLCNNGMTANKSVPNPSVASHDDLPTRTSLDLRRAPSREQKTVADILSGPVDFHFEGDDDLFHPHVGPIMNPRDHSVLETAHNELHAARFINLSPLSVLSSMLAWHFVDVRSHEPVQVLFPPLDRAESDREITPTLSPSRQQHSPTPLSGTIDQRFPGSAVSPQRRQHDDVSRHTFPGIQLRPLGTVMTRDSSPMSIQEWGLEQSILNMHLSARASEILSCAEEMWELIQEAGRSPERWRNSALAALADVSKEQWEDCLARYQMDMQDKISLGTVFSKQFGWPMPAVARTPERKAFDEAVDKWEKQRKRREKKNKKEKQCVSRVFRVFTARKG